ncbi:AIS_collapsed_G0004820.mRNA.1.CDS.1 [Saccharomyces cerevisiae]|nr:AIS_HP1_G0004740.mRNA.1.CDS.1 [Saccharomyces cerevisiae]CAI6510844.1 AIS_collapsed_G0004820.mRNA.1.CDS.1 [Saccharomyces cerevisiae]
MEIPTICSGLSHPITKRWQSSKRLSKDMLVYPLFVSDDPEEDSGLEGMEGLRRRGISKLIPFVSTLVEKGLRSVILFGIVENSKKDAFGTQADAESGPVIKALKALRSNFPGLFIICDVCMCEYTTHGHCGLLSPEYEAEIQRGKSPLLLAESIDRITEIALNYAKFGADSVAPSDMMDGRIKSIKDRLYQNGFGNRVFVMSYSAKFSSELYKPFRDIACSKPSFGDRTNYQFPHTANGYFERAILKDTQEGSDCIIIKPSLFYLDAVYIAASDVAKYHPICIYQVSGEYALLDTASKAGLVDAEKIVLESHESFVRAGASIIISYFTPQLLDWLKT